MPSLRILAHHRIHIPDHPLGNGTGDDDVASAAKLKQEHKSWLCNVSSLQIVHLLSRFRAKSFTSRVEGASLSRRQRVQGLPPLARLLARASKHTKDEDIRKVFTEVDADGKGRVRLEDLRSYFGDYLGFGLAELVAISEGYDSEGIPYKPRRY